MTTPDKVAPAPSFPGDAQIRGCTTVITVALLLLATGSAVEELMLAVLVSGPGFEGVFTVMVIVAVAPCAIVPVSEQVTVAAPEQVQPAGALDDTNVVPAGMVSVRATVAAFA